MVMLLGPERPPSAFRVSVVAAFQLIGALTMMLPVLAPALVVEIVMLLVTNAVLRVVTLMFDVATPVLGV